MPLPAGLAYQPGGGIILNPDAEVQARLRLVFAKFRELQGARAVMRALLQAGLPLPVRPLRGPAPHVIEWRAPSSSRSYKSSESGLCWRVCIWPATAGSEPAQARAGHTPSVAVPIEDCRFACETPLPATSVGRVYGQSETPERQSLPLSRRPARRRAQGLGSSARPRSLRPLRAAYGVALFWSRRKLSGLSMHG